MKSLENYIVNHETARMFLKTLTGEHVSDEYVSWLNDPEVNQYLEVRHMVHTPENVAGFVGNMLASENNLQMGMFLKDGDRHIGNIKIGPVNARYGRGDIGLLIGDKDCWGKGYASEAIAGICEIGRVIGVRRLQAGAYASNIASIKAFEKCGFEREGVMKAYWVVDGAPEDEILVGKVL